MLEDVRIAGCDQNPPSAFEWAGCSLFGLFSSAGFVDADRVSG